MFEKLEQAGALSFSKCTDRLEAQKLPGRLAEDGSGRLKEADSGMGKNLFDLKGKVAFVTGAGGGLGRAISTGLAEYGADVVAVGRTQEAVEQTGELVRGQGRQCMALSCDVSQEGQVAEAVRRAVEQFQRIDILVNNAGVTKRIPIAKFRREDFQPLIQINLIGTFLCCQAVGRIMLKQQQGSILNISALSALVGLGRGNAMYSATKGAILALTRELANEWGPYGIRVNALAPFWFRTPMIGPVLEDHKLMERILDAVPLGKIGEPRDLIGTVVFFGSEASSLITGQVVAIDGGLSTTFTPPKAQRNTAM